MAHRRRKRTQPQQEERHEEKGEKTERSGFDFSKVFTARRMAYLGLLLILIPLFLSVFFRMQPAILPMTDQWAQDSVHNYFQQRIQSQVSQQYPNLPQQQKQQMVQEQFNTFLENNEQRVQQRIARTSESFKQKMKTDDGQTYLLAIDPWLFYGAAENYIENGHTGDTMKEGEPHYSLRNGRFGKGASTNFLVYLEVLNYKIMNALTGTPAGLLQAMTVLLTLLVILLIIAAVAAGLFFASRQFAGLGPSLGITAGGAAVAGLILILLFPSLISGTEQILNFFRDSSMMTAAFYVPVILVTLAVMAMFFLGYTLGGYPAALTASIILAVHAGLLGRTAAGFADTDNIIAFGEVVPLLFFVLAFEAKNHNWRYAFIGLASALMAFYSSSHASWWHLYDFMLGALGIYFVYLLLAYRKELSKGIKRFVNVERVRHTLEVGVGFVFASMILNGVGALLRDKSFLGSLREFAIDPFVKPFAFMQQKAVAKESVWPNVVTTVAERGGSNIDKVINQIGGPMLLFLSLLGIVAVFLIMRRERRGIFYGAFLIFWFIGATYAANSSMRFIAFLVPAFALSLGILAYALYEPAARWISREFKMNRRGIQAVIAVIFIFIVLMPLVKSGYNTATQEIPSMNDAWYDSLKEIKHESPEDSIITSWWDFGHWFVAVADRHVTFDGGDQGERIHWVGKSLLTDNETMAVGLLRMLNCGQEKPPHIIEKYVDNDSVEAVDILNDIMVRDVPEARSYLEQEGFSDEAISEILNYSHCAAEGKEIYENYYITSDDMVGKSGVWGHFGSWNFTKAAMYQDVRDEDREAGIRILKEDFGLSQERASQLYFEIRNNKADDWVAEWPSYFKQSGCRTDGNTVQCNNGLKVNLQTHEAEFQGANGQVPQSLVYAGENDIIEKEFEDSNMDVSAALVPQGNGQYRSILMHPRLAKSTFTRLYFFNGHGSDCFDQFSRKQSFNGNEIIVWDVDWNCTSRHDAYSEEKESEIHARHILVSDENRTEQEAEERAKNIASQVNSSNFEELARQYSDGPSASEGGDLGWFGRGQMVQGFSDAAFALKKGEISEPVKTDFGYHVIQVVDTRNNS